MKDKGDLELEIIVLNEYVCVRRGRVGRWREVGVHVDGAQLPKAGHVAHAAVVWSPLVKGCTGLKSGWP